MIILLILIMFPAVALADYLVCDIPPANQNITPYKVSDNDIELTDNQPAETDGSLKYDLGIIDSAAHRYEAVACNKRGCSEASDPFVLPSAAGKPQNMIWTKDL